MVICKVSDLPAQAGLKRTVSNISQLPACLNNALRTLSLIKPPLGFEPACLGPVCLTTTPAHLLQKAGPLVRVSN